MLVSVIVPNYNHSFFLEQRVDTILNQTYQDFEVIILDDCSTDDSREVIEQYRGHEKVSHIIYNPVNGGSTFLQWEKGIKAAKGEWIWIAESDDYCEPTFLETLITEIDSSYSIAYSQSLVFNNTGEVLWYSTSSYVQQTLDGNVFVKQLMLDGNSIFNSSMCIFRRSLFSNIDDTFTHYKFCGDWLFWIEVALKGKIFISGKVLNYFRKHNKDVSSKAYKTGLLYFEYIELINDLVIKNIISTEEKKKLLLKKHHEFLNDRRVDKENRNSVNSMFVDELGSRKIEMLLRYNIKKIIKSVRS